MAEYIERTEELILAVNAGARAIENNKRYHGTIYSMDVFYSEPREIPYLKAAEVLRSVDEIPAADVVERKRGEWIDHMVRDWRCSECGRKVPRQVRFDGYCCDDKLNFCPNCGADMRGEKDG